MTAPSVTAGAGTWRGKARGVMCRPPPVRAGLWARAAIASTGLWLVLAAQGGAQEAGSGGMDAPMSAIDWLSQSVEAAPVIPDEPPVADSAAAPEITVTPLDLPSPDRVGLLGPAITGLPRNLWAGSESATLVTLVQAQRVEGLPAMQDLLSTLMIAEADPPLGAGPEGLLFVARIDKLLELGALDPAQEMLRIVGPANPELFRRWFDVALLNGTEDSACAVMRDRPGVAPTFPAQIFCLARSGDWRAAALSLSTARAIGDVSDEDDILLSRFLDPDLYEEDGPLPPPSRMSPLVFRLREAVGEALPTVGLPRAFSHADLRSTTGWRSQIEAAERLVRNGAVTPSVLFDLYTARTPAASGGVWDRAAAIRRLDAALEAAEPEAVATALPAAWAAMQAARVEVPFARLYGPAIARLDLTGTVAELALQIGLLSDDYEAVALRARPEGASASQRTLLAIARGQVQDMPLPAPDARHAAIRAAFDNPEISATLVGLVDEDRLGEALLRAIAGFNEGVAGDPAAISESLALFRAVGLEDMARRAGLQYLLLDRPS